MCFLPADIFPEQRIFYWWLMTSYGDSFLYFFPHSVSSQTYPVVSQQALQLVAVPLSHIPPPAQLQFGQELFQGSGAVAVPAGWMTRAPLHDLLLQDLLNPMKEMCEMSMSMCNCGLINPNVTFRSSYFNCHNLPVLKLCCSCFVCAAICQLLWLKNKFWFSRKLEPVLSENTYSIQ